MVCSLTDALPDFEDTCPDFVEDPYEVQSKNEFSQETKVAIGNAAHHSGMEKRMAGGSLLGVVLLLISVLVGCIQLLYFDGLGRTPIILFMTGGVAIMRDVLKKHL